MTRRKTQKSGHQIPHIGGSCRKHWTHRKTQGYGHSPVLLLQSVPHPDAEPRSGWLGNSHSPAGQGRDGMPSPVGLTFKDKGKGYVHALSVVSGW